VYGASDVERLVELYLAGADRDRLDPILDRCVEVYLQELDEDGQVDFKGKAKAFIRTYSFLATILPYGSAEWEKLSIFLNFLVPKLPAPKEEDLSKGILEAIDMDSYRVEVRAAMAIALPDENAEVGPVPTSSAPGQLELEMERLSAIVREFNDRFGGIEWNDADKIRQVITDELPAKVSANEAYQNARERSDRQNARIESNRAVQEVINSLLTDHTQLFKLYYDNESFRRDVEEMVFRQVYGDAAPGQGVE